MQSQDIFKRLAVGTRFNFKKFATDAKRLSIKSNDTDLSAGQSTYQLTKLVPEDEVVDSNSKKNKPNKKAKSKNKLIELNIERVNRLRNLNKITVHGSDINEPIESFENMNVDPIIMENIRKSNYERPTPIQMQTIPLMLAKRQLLCCAPTGSGKTLAFLIPIIQQLSRPQKSGFRAVILAPTRELAKQIHRECLWISYGTGLRAHIIKNVNLAKKKFDLNSHLKFDILVTTPNRLVWLLQQEPVAINIQNVEWLVIDECDKLFELGFRDQLSIIYEKCNQSQRINHAMFSATHDIHLEKWAQLNLDNMVTVIIGGKNRASEVVDQKLTFVGDQNGKLIALRDVIANGCEAPVLIFVERIEKAKQLFKDLINDGINVDVIHSERSQQERDNVVRSFREGKVWFLVCTELMGRGIDFKGVNLVINYDFPSSAISYIHRIGRTGRAGRKGQAITFFTEKDSDSLRTIANVMRRSGCDVPKYMLELNKKKDSRKRKRFNKSQNKFNKQKDKSKKHKTEKIEAKNVENDEEIDSEDNSE